MTSGVAPVRRGRLRALTWSLLVLVSVSCAGALLAIRWFVPRLNQHAELVQQTISRVFDRPVTMAGLQTEWRGWRIAWRLRDLRIFDDKGGETVRLRSASVTVDPLDILLGRDIALADLQLTGANLAVERARDGGIHIAGGKSLHGAGASGGSREALSRLLLRQPQIRLNDSTITWTDRKRNRPPFTVTGLNARLVNSADDHALQGSFNLARNAGAPSRFDFELRVTGSPLSANWRGQAHMRGARIDLGLLPIAGTIVGMHPTAGLGDLEFWADLNNGGVARIDGRFSAADLILNGPSDDISLPRASGNLRLLRDGELWRVNLDKLRLTTPTMRWPETEMQFAIHPGGAARAPNIQASVGYLRLEDIVPVIRAYTTHGEDLNDRLGFFKLRGDLSNVTVTVHDASNPGGNFRLVADFSNLATGARRGFPGFAGLAGKLDMGASGGTVRFEDRAVKAFIPDLFDQALNADKVLGAISWYRQGLGWRVATDGIEVSNADLALTLAGATQWRDNDQWPLLSLVVNMRDGDLRKLPAYLPTRLLSKDAADWLSHSLPAGRVTQGRLLFRGRVNEFPFDQGQGVFEAYAHVAGTVLDYAEQWPAARELDAELHFKGRGLTVTVKDGEILGARVLSARGEIADLDADVPMLKVRGRIAGDTRQSLRFLRESPLKKDFNNLLGVLSANGKSKLAIDLAIPLTADQPVRVKGRLDMRDNRLAHKALAISMEKVTGTLRFTDSSVTASQISARFLGQDVTLDITRAPSDDASVVTLRGDADKTFITRVLDDMRVIRDPEIADTLRSRISGRTNWRADLSVPDSALVRNPRARFTLRSDLRGMTLDLPAPLGKSADETRQLSLQTDLSGGERKLVAARWGDIANAKLALRMAANSLTFERGALRLGKQPANLPKTPGFAVGGTVAQLSVDAWIDLLRSQPPADPAAVAALMRDFNVNVQSLRFAGYDFDDVNVSVEKLADQTLDIAINGPDVAGSILVAKDPELPIVVDMDRLYLGSRGQVPGREPDPRELRDITFACRDFAVHGLHIGVLKFSTSRQTEGLRIDSLFAGGGRFEAHGNGRWTAGQSGGSSRFSLEITGNELGRILVAMGFDPPDTAGGTTEMLFDAVWPGGPGRFDITKVIGALHVKSTRGRILDIDTGATGRIFGLLNIQSLPRRLKLDFDDMFKYGFEFERIEGNFTLESGNAYTSDLVIDGSDANIQVTGRTGLVTEDYDQQVTVVPKVSSSTLPLVGGLVGGPAGIGWGALVWVAERMLSVEDTVNNFAAVKYSVTGPWRKPNIQPINSEHDALAADDG